MSVPTLPDTNFSEAKPSAAGISTDTLLGIAEALIGVRCRVQLQQVISEHVLTISGCQVLSVGMPDEERNFWTCWFHSSANERADRFLFQDGLFDVTFGSEEPSIWRLKSLLTAPQPPAFLLPYSGSGGVWVVGSPIKAAGRLLGCLFMLFTECYWLIRVKKELSVLSGQIGACVGNILANEKATHRMEEIRRNKEMLEEEKNYWQEASRNQDHAEMIGQGEAMSKVHTMIRQVASSSATVLINGETGTGKELVARAIHEQSARKDRMMIKVNCAAIPHSLIESELFGHEKGSFTGARERKIGKFELAHKGTLFLDEVGEMPLDLQTKLLRVLQEKEIERIGGRTTIPTDIRIIAATNRDLQREMNIGNFRADLFYRLHVFPIQVPPLRERKEDIPGLVSYFLQKYAGKSSRPVERVSPQVMEQLIAYNWPGNIRELEHLIERSVLLTSGPIVEKFYHLIAKVAPAANKNVGYVKTIHELEREHILFVLKLCNGKVSGEGGAAERLRIPPTTLMSKIKRLGIKRALSRIL